MDVFAAGMTILSGFGPLMWNATNFEIGDKKQRNLTKSLYRLVELGCFFESYQSVKETWTPLLEQLKKKKIEISKDDKKKQQRVALSIWVIEGIAKGDHSFSRKNIARTLAEKLNLKKLIVHSVTS
eukprot:Selendium_serpulae@DN9526_c0_g1_i1.p1